MDSFVGWLGGVGISAYLLKKKTKHESTDEFNAI